MLFKFKKGDHKTHSFQVSENDFAHFRSEMVHSVCSTFALAREIEWSTRLFVKEMLEEGEEGIGTSLSISHVGPAFFGDTVEIIATFEDIRDKEIRCSYEARVNKRLVATGHTGQRILLKEKLHQIFEKFN